MREAITEYNKESETIKSSLINIEEIIKIYETIEEKIKGASIDNYDSIKEEIEQLKDDYPENLKEDLLNKLDNVVNGKKDIDIFSQGSFSYDFKQDTYQNIIRIKEEEIEKKYDSKTETLKSDIKTLKNEIASLGQQLKLTEELLKNQPNIFGDYSNNLALVAKLRSDIETKKQQILEKEQELETIESEKKIIVDEIEEQKDYIANIENPEVLINKIDSANEKFIDEAKEELEVLLSKEQELKVEITSINKNINILTEEISNMKNAESAILPEHKEAYNNILKSKLEALKEEKNKLTKKEEELDKVKNSIKQNKSLINKMETESNTRKEYYNFILKITKIKDSKEKSELIEEIQNSSLNQKLKEEIIEKLENYSPKIDDSIEVIKTYKESVELIKENINERDNVIALYNEVSTKINDIKNKVETKVLPSEEEIKSIEELIEKLPESLKADQQTDFDNVLSDIQKLKELQQIKEEEPENYWHEKLFGETKEEPDVISNSETEDLSNNDNTDNISSEEVSDELLEDINPTDVYIKDEMVDDVDEEIDSELEEENKPTKIEQIKEALSKRKNWIKGIAGLAVGAGALTIAPVATGVIAVGVGATALGVKAWKKHKKSTEPIEESEITKIETPNEKQQSIAEKFKNLLKKASYLKDAAWSLTSRLLGEEEKQLEEDVELESDKKDIGDIKLGEKTDGYNLTQGHNSATWAVSEVNAEELEEGITYNSMFTRFAVVNPDGSIKQIINTKGISLSDFLEESGYTPEQIAIEIEDNSGEKVWTTANQLLKETRKGL